MSITCSAVSGVRPQIKNRKASAIAALPAGAHAPWIFLSIEDVTIAPEQDFQVRALLFVPDRKVAGAVIALPDAEQSCEEFTGIAEGAQSASSLSVLLGQHLAVCVPVVIERKTDYPFGGRTGVDRRQLLYRLGFIVGERLWESKYSRYLPCEITW